MFLLTEPQFTILQGLFATGSPTRFADIYDQIHAWVQAPDARGNIADGNVVAWFGAAAQTNRGVGGASDFIRTYTAAQLEIREGTPITYIGTLMQQASNAIAEAVYTDILRVRTRSPFIART